MTHEEILKGLYDNTLIGNAPEVKDLTNKGVEDGLEPESMLYDALIPSLEEVGARFERGLSALAAPVFGPDGIAVAALSVSGPTIRLTPDRIAELAPALLEQARLVSMRLGNHDQRGAA